ncbi:MAG: 50S ribosomal protein L10 [Ilumatobacteraceae bacterium]
MENAKTEKAAVVAEVKTKLDECQAVFITEYRGMTVGQLADLRNQLRPAGTEYKVYKNTLVRRAAAEAGIEGLESQLVGPTAIAFVNGDIATAAKALREFAKTNPMLVVKGGALGTAVLSEADVKALADLPSREVLLAQIAGAFQAPMVKMAGLLQALPRNFAYGLKALIDQQAAA